MNAGKPCDCGQCEVCKVFGTGNAKTIDELTERFEKGEKVELPGPPRLKVYDAYLTWESLQRLKEATGDLLTEIKTENQINRITSRANPRKVERVPAGAIFEGKMVFDLYKDTDVELFGLVVSGMRLLEDNYLGGYGSRGSGRVKFEDIRIVFRPREYYLGTAQEREVKSFESLEGLTNQELQELISNLSRLVRGGA